MITEKNKGKKIETFEELMELLSKKKSIFMYQGGTRIRVPIAVVVNWNFSIVYHRVKNGDFYLYVSTHKSRYGTLLDLDIK